jgi:adenylate cyclase
MSRISLKNIINKDGLNQLLNSILELENEGGWIEDDKGNCLLGSVDSENLIDYQHVEFDDNIVGKIYGNKNVDVAKNLLQLLYKKELEKKKLGSEVLHYYQELNLIFNFSEKLAQTIDPNTIAQITLEEANRVIQSNHGVVLLWDEVSRRLETTAIVGELFFEPTKINQELPQLFNLVMSGQSEIITDTTTLINAGIIKPEVKAVIYSALKVKHRIMGAIILASENQTEYTAEDLKLLTTLALQSSAAIESALLYEKNIKEAKEREEAMRRLYEVTGKFVPYEFIDSLGHAVITDIKLGDQVQKIVTVLFSDIRNYTTLSEGMTPEENFRFICSFNEKMGPIIRKNKGFINQYLGDAIMAIFPGNAKDALSAAVEMQLSLKELNDSRIYQNMTPIFIGIGMHSGPLIMGITGDKDRLDATTISDTVNTAARIESLTKFYKASIILSDASMQQIENTDQFHLRHLGLVQLKGKQKPIRIHECFSGNHINDLQCKINSLDVFNEGMINYVNKSFENAKKAFGEVTRLNPEDATADFFHSKVEEIMQKGISDTWVGIMEMNEK